VRLQLWHIALFALALAAVLGASLYAINFITSHKSTARGAIAPEAVPMRLEVHHFYHLDKAGAEQLCRIEQMLGFIHERQELIMAKIEDVDAALDAVSTGLDGISTEVGKVSGETSALLAQIADLRNQVTDPAMQEKIDAVVVKALSLQQRVADLDTAVKAVDDLVPDAPTS
jgi:hypothetical protein